MKKLILFSSFALIAILTVSCGSKNSEGQAAEPEEIVIDTTSAGYFAFPLNERYTQFTRNNRQTWGITDNGKVLFPDDYFGFELIYDNYFFVYKRDEYKSFTAVANSEGKIIVPFDTDCTSYAVVSIDGKEYVQAKETGKTDYTYFDSKTGETFVPAKSMKVEYKEYDNPYAED